MYWLSNLMCDLIFSIYNPSYYHLFLKEQECHVMLPFFLKLNGTKHICYKQRLSILFRESLFLWRISKSHRPSALGIEAASFARSAYAALAKI